MHEHVDACYGNKNHSRLYEKGPLKEKKGRNPWALLLQNPQT